MQKSEILLVFTTLRHIIWDMHTVSPKILKLIESMHEFCFISKKLKYNNYYTNKSAVHKYTKYKPTKWSHTDILIFWSLGMVIAHIIHTYMYSIHCDDLVLKKMGHFSCYCRNTLHCNIPIIYNFKNFMYRLSCLRA